MKHEHTQHIAAAPDRVFEVLSDVGRLPDFVPQMTAARAGDGDEVVIDARYEGHTQHGKGWFRPDPERQPPACRSARRCRYARPSFFWSVESAARAAIRSPTIVTTAC
jgi:hypothetical protein